MKELLVRVPAGVAVPPSPPGADELPPADPVAAEEQPVLARLGRAVEKAAGRLAAWEHFDATLVIFLVALTLALRWRTLWTSYWGDEAIAIGIAAQPLHALPKALVNDGSPPLYYVLLHYWMQLFGRSEPATHSLSMVAALAAVPTSWWCGDKLFGRWAARGAAALVATCAYVGYYSTETRMYSWLALAALLALSCFVLAYQGAGRRYWAAAVVSMVAVLYLHYYGLYLFAAVGLVGVVAALANGAYRRVVQTLLYGLACAAAFAPWVPQFVYQLTHTGAPWAPRPSVVDLFVDPFNALASAAWLAVVVAIAVAVLGRRRWPVLVPRYSAKAQALELVTAVPLVALLLAWTGAQFVNSWDPRYLGVVVVPALLPLAGGLARVRRGLAVLCGTVVALAATATPVLVDRNVTVETSKSDAAYLLASARTLLRPGDLVISAQVTDAPVIALDLGNKFTYANPLGVLKDPLIVDWSNLPTRLQSINAASDLTPLLDKLPVGRHVLLVDPASWDRGESPERYSGAVEAEAVAANQVVLSDPALQLVRTETVPRYSDPRYPMRLTLFVKTAA
ncbi:MAG: glycosyltransferase family 39 protein [Acidimicrobiales bacterium]